ncbi:MAG TPA: ANTAR domain-containing protein [Pseudonocardiaceae bacterium]|nr:ANTAR domain-containing protein [Pseudonocardiaceae bacterium]
MAAGQANEHDERAELAALRSQLEGMRRAMASRAVIEQAVGLLAGVYSVDPETAFEHLVRLSQHHNVKLRGMAAVLIEVTAEAGPTTAGAVVQRLESADPLVDLAVARNCTRGIELARQLPDTVIDAARDLIAARDARDAAESPSQDEDKLYQARITFYSELVRLGWAPPLPVPPEVAETIDRDRADGQ